MAIDINLSVVLLALSIFFAVLSFESEIVIRIMLSDPRESLLTTLHAQNLVLYFFSRHNTIIPLASFLSENSTKKVKVKRSGAS